MGEVDIADMLQLLEEAGSVDSWLSRRLRGRSISCPNCGREITADPLVRAEVVFQDWEWSDTSGRGANIAFYA
jgi:hypothetical protein